jgi:tyrosyl-tRNA synthetase
VKVSAETYLRQFSKVVDRELTEIRWQSEWFDRFTLTTIVGLAAKFTVNQMLKREDFAQRFSAQKPVGVHELFYPLLQAYDSVAVQADVEFGGTDQTFNLLVGRELQPGSTETAVLYRPLTVYGRRRWQSQALHRAERPRTTCTADDHDRSSAIT